MGFPDSLPQEMVRLAELDGDHDATVHGFIQVVRPIGGHDYQTIVSGERERRSANDYCTIGSLYIPKLLIPFNLCEEHVDLMASFLPALKDGLALVKEQNSVVDFGLAENELEVLARRHVPQRWEVDQENLDTKRGHNVKKL